MSNVTEGRGRTRQLATVRVKTPDGELFSEVVDYSPPPPECAIADDGGPIHCATRKLFNKAMKAYTSPHYFCDTCDCFHKKSVCEDNEELKKSACKDNEELTPCREKGFWPCSVCVDYHS